MQNLFSAKTLLFTIAASFILLSCQSPSPNHWSDAVPDSAPFLVVPQQGSTISDLLNAPYAALFDDISPTAFQLVNEIEEAAGGNAEVEAMILYTDTSNDWQPIWITKSVSGLMGYLTEQYQKEFEQNRYNFAGYTIEKLFISDREIFIVELGDWTIFSESSLGIENMLRTLQNSEDRMDLSQNELEPGSFIINTPKLAQWVQQMAQVTYRPGLMNIFDGAMPVSMNMNDQEDAEWSWQLSGSVELQEDPATLLRAVSAPSGEFTLDRYIPMNAAAFSILNLSPRMVPANDWEPNSDADEYLNENSSAWENIASSLDSEFAFASFAESGAASSSEFLYLRHLSAPNDLRSALGELVSEGVIDRDGDAYLIQSEWLGKLIGSDINPMTDFYLMIYQDVAIIAQRKGLAESISGDASRRRVMYYDDDYRMLRGELEENLSSITVMDAQEFGTYVQPWLYPQNYFSALAANLDLFVISTQSDGDSSFDLSFTSIQREVDDQPYRERWVFPLNDTNISGTPITADISGSSRDEVIFTTDRGTVYALATDGTVVLETTTDGDDPVGPPVVYDWYGNNQNVIMQAAGNKIYAWNTNGNLLPNFPMELNEQISTPITVTDITRNGVAEVIVGTADRNLHILNSRGNALSGWPQSTNATITEKPLITEFGGQRSIIASTENTIHSWLVNGERRDGFPVFLDTQIHGNAAVFGDDYLLSAGRDGNLYSIGTEPLFADSLSSTFQDDSLQIQSVQVADGSLNATPSSENLLFRDDEGEFYSEDVIILQSSSGSIFLYNRDGILRFTTSLGQPASDTFAPKIIDLDRNQRMDIVALADFGRLYAWDILQQERLYDLPTSGMQYPLIADLTGDGNYEVVAQTRDGVRAWTIFQTSRDN